MKRPHLKISWKKALLYLIPLPVMVLMNLSLPMREPVSLSLAYALMACGLDPFILSAEYVLASAPALSLAASLASLLQGLLLAVSFALLARAKRKPLWIKLLLLAAAQLPFLFLYPHAGYAAIPLPVLLQKLILSLFLILLSLLFEGAVRALLFRAFRCRLMAAELSELVLLWFFTGLGLYALGGDIPYLFVTLLLLLIAVIGMKNATAVPFALVLSAPLCAATMSVVPAAEYALLACAGLLFSSYGSIVTALSVFLAFLGVQYFEGLFAGSALEISLTLCACFIPAALCAILPERTVKRLRRSLLFYRERALPRIAINRNRRAVGEQLYEVSSLFREIEAAFTAESDSAQGVHFKEKLIACLCASCPNRRKCRETGIYESFEKLIAVGKAKGRVNLIDLPQELSASCRNSAGILFALNKLLADYRRMEQELEAARAGRRLLAEQAHGVSEILKDIALEQSEEFAFSEEERLLSAALSAAGMMSTEIFLYGEGTLFTATVTLAEGLDTKRLCAVASHALGIPLALSEKLPLSADRACYILRRRPDFDASFGIAACPKAGEVASGDTHSVLKIDERRFMVALSDGMGSGDGARAVSDRTLSLLESCYKAKMPSTTVLSTVNRLIALSGEETFSCLDVASVDLDTGDADIVKIGSPMGFLLSGEELRVLEGESLPIGMLETVHPATMRVNMKAEDFLIFMSDGVTAAFGSSAELCAYLSALRPLNPQSLAEDILKNALGRYHGSAEDDMTVLAVKLTRAA